MSTTGQSHSDDHSPLPSRYFRWYLLFWHIVYLGLLAIFLGIAFWDAWPNLGWPQLALVGLVAVQVGLYARLLIFVKRWPFPWQWLATYFLGSLAIWYIEWHLSPIFFPLVWSYFGQMLGILPPIAALPGSAILLIYAALQNADWDFSRLTAAELIGYSISWVSISVLFLFVYTTSRTSAERGALIAKLKAAQQELEASRQRESELAVLRERERLARDLHDNLGHALVTFSVQLEAIQRLYKVDPGQASAQLDELKTLTRTSMDDLRRSLEGLRTSGLGDRPLAQALPALCVEISQRHNLAVDCHIDQGLGALTPVVAETIWRVSEEALTNVGRHAQARHVHLALTRASQTVTLRIADDGLGLPQGAETRPGHYGLRGIRERAEGLGGALTYSESPGTTLIITLPLIKNAS